MLDIYCKVSQEMLCMTIMWGPSTCSAFKGVLQVSIFGEMHGKEGLVMAEWNSIDISTSVYIYQERPTALRGYYLQCCMERPMSIRCTICIKLSFNLGIVSEDIKWLI